MVKFWGSQKLCMDFQLHVGSLNPHAVQGSAVVDFCSTINTPTSLNLMKILSVLNIACLTSVPKEIVRVSC